MLCKSLVKQGLEVPARDQGHGGEGRGRQGRAVLARRKDGQRLGVEVRQGPGRRRPPAVHRGAGAGRGRRRRSTRSGHGPGRQALPHQRPDHLRDRRPDRRPDAGPQGRGRRGRLRRDPGGQGRARRLRHDPERHLHLARNGQRRDHRGAGQGGRKLDTGSASSRSSPTAAPRRWTRPRAWSRSSPTRRPTACSASTSSARAPRT